MRVPVLQGAKEEILQAWKQYEADEQSLVAFIDAHAGFLTIDAVAYPEAHKKAFECYFGAYLRLVSSRLEVLKAMTPEAQKMINAERSNAVRALKWKTLSDKTILRVYSGGAYSKTLKDDKQFDAEIARITKLWWTVLKD
jgi:hypothetical protein